MPSNMKREVITREYYPDGGMKQVASQGQRGDTELAHVNPWEQALLKRLGGAGTTNPKTGLRQYFDEGMNDVDANDQSTGQAMSGIGGGLNDVDANDASIGQAMTSNQISNALDSEDMAAGRTALQNAGIKSYDDFLETLAAGPKSSLWDDLKPVALNILGFLANPPGKMIELGAKGVSYVIDYLTEMNKTPEGKAKLAADFKANFDAMVNAPMNQGNEDQNQSISSLAAQGQNGDTQLAEVNPYQQWILKKLGGAGTVNPTTGLKQFYTNEEDPFYTAPAGWSANTYLANHPSVANDPWYKNNPLAHANIFNPTELTGSSTSGNNIMFPDDPSSIYPSSSSSQSSSGWNESLNNSVMNSQNTSNNNSQNTSQNVAQNTNESLSTGYGGLSQEFRDILMQALMPQLTSSITNMEPNIDKYVNEALGSYSQEAANAIKNNIPISIANLAKRGILNSTEGQKVLSDVYSKAATDASTKGYTTAMQAALLKANTPTILSQIAELGKYNTSLGLGIGQGTSQGYSQGTSTGSSQGTSSSTSTGMSKGTTGSSGSSYSQDPTQMWSILASMVNNDNQ